MLMAARYGLDAFALPVSQRCISREPSFNRGVKKFALSYGELLCRIAAAGRECVDVVANALRHRDWLAGSRAFRSLAVHVREVIEA